MVSFLVFFTIPLVVLGVYLIFKEKRVGLGIVSICVSLFFAKCGIDYEIEESKKSINQRKLEKQFSSWDGSHREATSLIKNSMNDPESYEHIKTLFKVNSDTTMITVTTEFRGKNVFGALVVNEAKTIFDIDGNLILGPIF
jgi:multisubunit Na+/H+ antiporter MnhC subunit